MSVGTSRVLDWAIASRPAQGQTVSGDAAVVSSAGDSTLVAAVDALGHGPEAAHAAAVAVSILDESAGDQLASVIVRCHEALRATRGAAISAASVSDSTGTITWIGVGNVEGRLVRRPRDTSPEEVLLGSGIAGAVLPPLAPATLTVARGNLLVFATDGIDGSFADSLDVSGPTQQIADGILADHGKPADDALVVVARFLGGPR
ncbi:MAG: SpoIIE family protein phosphatase [Thermoleophilia bacterium]|nr:SpoIIE family protein phosphatase [Thermoleophilia bacterium]